LRGDNIERLRRGGGAREFRCPPLDAGRQVRTGVAGVLSASFQRDAGNVDRDHRPPAAGQPDRVGPLTTPHVERPAGWPAGDLSDQLRVRIAAPYPLRRTVSLVPEILAEHLPGAVCVL